MSGSGDVERRILKARLGAARLVAACVLIDGRIVYEDGEPKGEGVPERYSTDYEQFVDVASLVDAFEVAPLGTRRRILKAVAVLAAADPGRVERFLPHLPYCLLLRSVSVEFESRALRVIERYADHLRDRDEPLPPALRRTVPVLATRLDGASSVPDHEKYGTPLIHLERVAPGALAPYLDVFVHPSHTRGERRIHVPSRAVDSIEADPDGADVAFRRAASRIVDRRRGSYDPDRLADDVVAVSRLLASASRSDQDAAPSAATAGLVRGTLLAVRDTADSGRLREATDEAIDRLAAAGTAQTSPRR